VGLEKIFSQLIFLKVMFFKALNFFLKVVSFRGLKMISLEQIAQRPININQFHMSKSKVSIQNNSVKNCVHVKTLSNLFVIN
jgi:hypothetical protein